MSRVRANIERAILSVLLCVTLNGGHANQALITDDFDFGTWSPFLSKWQKSVPVCIWDETNPNTTFRVEARSLSSNSNFRLASDLDEKIPYRVHWRSGSGYQQIEKLQPGVSSSGVFNSQDASRCESGPTGLLRVTINSKQLQSAEPGVYADTLYFTISPL